MDYTISRRDDVRLVKVSFPGLFPVGELAGSVSNGSISGTSTATVKWVASFDYVGGDLSDGDCIKVIADLDNGIERESVVLGTFRVYAGSEASSGSLSRVSYSAYSLVKIAHDARFRVPYNVPVGSDAFDHVESILTSVGLRLAYRPDELHTVRTSHSYLPEDYTKLEIVNELLDMCGYLSADTDENGFVVLRRHAPTPVHAPISLSEGDSSIIEDESTVERDWEEIHNVITGVVDNADGEPLRSTIVCDDPANQLSTIARGEICRVEKFSDVESIDVLNDKLSALLSDELSRLEAVKGRCAYVPLRLFGPVKIKKGSIDGVYTVQSLGISLDKGLMTEFRARRFI